MKKALIYSLTVMFLFFVAVNNGSLLAEEEDFSALNSILQSCEELKGDERKIDFLVPGAWTVEPMKAKEDLQKMVDHGKLVEPVNVYSPYDLVENTINNIIEYSKEKKCSENMIDLRSGEGVISVNSLPRVLSIYDHDGDGFIGSKDGDITLNSESVRETGTFIKNILILPYLKALGYNTIHFQPITEIGEYGRKGNLGSPFAIKDPFAIDPGLADPFFPQGVEEQYKAFLEAAHALDMKVVQEVIPRTVSVDSKVLERNPEYGYWVIEGCEKRMPEYYNPEYEYVTSEGLKKFPDRTSFEEWFYGEYKDKIYGNTYDLSDLIDVNLTDPEYAGFFLPSPDVVERDPESKKLIGYYYKTDEEGNKIEGEIDETIKAEVLPAFCDTPFEIQPFWQDVTYLKLYVNKNDELPILEPLSFVTAKFFKDVEPEIEKKYRNEPVWEMITGYFDKFKDLGVDGFVMDMGHALPEDLKKDIKAVLPNVWEENLGINFEFLSGNPVVVTGNAFGYIFPSFYSPADTKRFEENPEETVNFHIKDIRRMFTEISEFDEYEGKMFGSPDNYNTKRVGQSPATRILDEAPFIEGTEIPDFTLAPVDQVKARKISLMYYALFKIMSEKGGSPFIFNPVFGNEFVATSTINVGLSTHIKEANRFYAYMTPEELAENPNPPKLLLMSKPDKSSGEWTNEDNFVDEILELNGVLEEIKPLLKENKHLQVIDLEVPEVLFLEFSNPDKDGEKLGVISNLHLGEDKTAVLPAEVKEYYLNKPENSPAEGEKGEITIPPGWVVIFTY